MSECVCMCVPKAAVSTQKRVLPRLPRSFLYHWLMPDAPNLLAFTRVTFLPFDLDKFSTSGHL